jgi:hypothetical protein
MAGVALQSPPGASQRARLRSLAALAAALSLAGTLAATAVGPPDAAGAQKKQTKRKARTAAAKSQTACVGELQTLYPLAPGAERFTMVIRINTIEDVNSWSDLGSGGLKPRVRDRDIFLINTRFQGSTAETEQRIATRLRQNFPCNRIFALNGLSYDAFSEGYMFALINAPQVSALLIDWEKLDWDAARETAPTLPAWVDTPFTAMLKRLKGRLAVLASTILANGGGKRIGLVPFARADWNLGLIARTIDNQARKIAPGGRGFQSSQTQKTCQTGGGAGLAGTIKGLFTQYKQANFKKVKPKRKGARPRFKRLKPKTQKLNLGVQISFTSTPDPTHRDPVKSVDISKAAECTSLAVFQKAGAILYWARPQDMAVLFTDPRMCALRPSPTGVCGSPL